MKRREFLKACAGGVTALLVGPRKLYTGGLVSGTACVRPAGEVVLPRCCFNVPRRHGRSLMTAQIVERILATDRSYRAFVPPRKRTNAEAQTLLVQTSRSVPEHDPNGKPLLLPWVGVCGNLLCHRSLNYGHL